MENIDIQTLIDRYNAQLATPEEIRTIESLIERGDITLEQLEPIAKLSDQLSAMQSPVPPADLDDRFYQMLAMEKKEKGVSIWAQLTAFFQWPQFAPKFAFAAVMLFAGVALGYFVRPTPPQEDMQGLRAQVEDLKEMMMLSLLEKESATERLKAVSLTEQMSTASEKVTDALIKTLNGDPNVNVRLAALDALKPYAQHSGVREALIRSIAQQDSPLVQVSLAELMAALQEKSSVKELQKIIQSDKTPKEVKTKIKETIDVLI